MSVENHNFTDRVKETQRIKLDFENGVNGFKRVSGKTRLVRVPPRRQQAQGKIIHVRHIVYKV